MRRLPSGRFQASYLDPDRVRRTAPATFRTTQDADAWLAKQRVVLGAGTWRDPSLALETFAVYSTRWIAERDLKPRTRGDYTARPLNRAEPHTPFFRQSPVP